MAIAYGTLECAGQMYLNHVHSERQTDKSNENILPASNSHS